MASQKKKIYLIGKQSFLLDLISYYLDREIDTESIILEDFSNIPYDKNKKFDASALLLVECPDRDHEILSDRLEKDDRGLIKRVNIALFNVNQGQGVEEKAVSCGVKGIFYNQDPLIQFQKGINAIFNGELWVSREVLTKYVMDKRDRDRSPDKEEALLTSREIEILTLISAGIKNEDIAEKLYISPNTVKTHIYNIFGLQKIFEMIR